jgi:hypothetical protein
MYRFQRRAPLELIAVEPPPVAERTGPPLSQGALYTMLVTVAADHLSPEALALLDRIDPAAWYHDQLLETILNDFEDRDPELPAFVGRALYYMFRPFLRQMGLRTAEDCLRALPDIFKNGTRGDNGWWRVEHTGPGRARVEGQQPYNCKFEGGTLVGLLEGLDAEDVHVEHGQCMRAGAPFCVFEIRYREGAEE